MLNFLVVVVFWYELILRISSTFLFCVVFLILRIVRGPTVCWYFLFCFSNSNSNSNNNKIVNLLFCFVLVIVIVIIVMITTIKVIVMMITTYNDI